MTKFSTLAVAGAVALTTLIPAQAGERSLKAKDIRNLFPGTYEARVRGYKVKIVARSNGSLSGSAFNYKDKGRWWIKGNRLCVAWSNWTGGRASCGVIARAGKWYVSRSSGGSMKFRRI